MIYNMYMYTERGSEKNILLDLLSCKSSVWVQLLKGGQDIDLLNFSFRQEYIHRNFQF